MPIAHILASCMGGIRTAGDLVAWMQMTKKMRLNEAKLYVADKLGIDVMDLINEDVMRPLREELGIGTSIAIPGAEKGIIAKHKIAKLLDIEINSVKLFHSKLK